MSLSLSLFILLALFAPTQLPASAEKGWLGEFLFRANPITSGEHYVGRLLVDGIPWDRELSWLISPIVGAVVFAALAAAVGHRFMHLRTGGPE